MTNEGRVCSLDGVKHRVVHNAFLLLLALAAVPGIFSLSGCSGLVGAQSSAGGTGVLSANPITISFGDVSVGSSATQSLSLTNTGTQAVNISATISGTDLTLVGGSPSIPAGQSSTIQIQFAPQLPGDVTGNVVLSSNASNSPLSVSVKGRGKGPRLTVSPTSVNFGNVSVGQTSTQNVQLTNSGNADLIVNLVTVSGNGFGITGLPLPTTISAGQSMAFNTQFAPATAGGATGSVSFTDNAPGAPQTLALTGSGGAAPVAPSITTQPASQSVTVGQAASFSVSATGTAPLSYQWQKNSVAIAGATSSSYNTPATTSSDNGAQFSVAVSNTAGAATSSAATLTVNAAPVAPSITTQPASQTVMAGQTASFSVAATGTAPLSYQWRKNSVAISGATSSGYTTPPTISSDSGAQFTVLVSNSAGSATSSVATLTVNAAPVVPSITAQPVSQTVTAGQTASFSVTATGTAPLSYQWQRSSVNIVAATSASYTTPATMTTDNGAQFTVVVSNPAGSVTSNAATLTVNAAIPPTFTVWIAPSLLRVGKTDAPGTASSVSLSSARGETADTQVVVQGPLSGLTNVNLSASALTGPGGASIPASSVTLYREYYITVTGTGSYGGGSNPPLGSGTYPEPLIPFNDPETGSPLCATAATLKACNATVNAGQNQPYWIDISVPRGATNSPPGTYTGTISITATQGNVTIPVTLTVWNFELPAQPSELSEWTLWNPAAGNITTLDQALMRNKLMGHYDVAANASSDMTSFGLNRSGLDGFYYIGIQCNGSYSSLPSTSQINAAAANFPAGLPLDFYVADELNGCSSAYSALKTMGTNAHAANPSVKTIMTSNTPDPNLYNEGDGRSAIDHWVLLAAVQQWPSLPYTGGGDLWSYASCNTGFGNAPAWMVDYPPINERMQAGFLNWTQGATGILYWRADGWTNGNTIASWSNVDTTGCGGGLGRPGDGIFLYPPGPIASSESAPGIRLKAIRDGIQDYEYAQILKNLGQVAFLNPILQPIATSWTNWSQDPNALEAARLQLGQKLHLLAP